MCGQGVECSVAETSLCTKWKNMCNRRLEHVEDFEMMSETASAEQVDRWSRMAEKADNTRLIDVTAMDIYNVALPTGWFRLFRKDEN